MPIPPWEEEMMDMPDDLRQGTMAEVFARMEAEQELQRQGAQPNRPSTTDPGTDLLCCSVVLAVIAALLLLPRLLFELLRLLR